MLGVLKDLNIVEIPIKHFNREYGNTVVFTLEEYQKYTEIS